MFERYTEQARRAIFYARYEASLQSAVEISTAHILLGLARETGSRADLIASLSKNSRQLRSVLRMPESIKTPPKSELMQDRKLDPDSKRAMVYSAEEANLDASSYIDTDHLLRGILRFPNAASGALQSISIDLGTAQAASTAHRAQFPNLKKPRFWIMGQPPRIWALKALKRIAIIVGCAIATDLLLRLALVLVRWLTG